MDLNPVLENSSQVCGKENDEPNSEENIDSSPHVNEESSISSEPTGYVPGESSLLRMLLLANSKTSKNHQADKKRRDSPDKKIPKKRLKKRENLECEICKRKFNYRTNLRTHVKHVHMQIRLFNCIVCKKSFCTKSNLAMHMTTHDNSIHFDCDECDKSFYYACVLKKHKQLKHSPATEIKDKSVNCDICNKRLSSDSSLRLHLKTVHVMYKCDVCCKRFEEKRDLDEHNCWNISKLIHYLKKYIKKSELSEILETTESGKKEYCCNTCDEKFPAYLLLIKHLEMHKNSNESSVNGSIKSEHLEDSAEQSSGEELTKCEICDKTFTQSYSVKKHILAVHMKIKRFGCNICKKRFTIKASLETHKKIFHRNKNARPYKCRICNNSYRHSGSLSTHMKTHCLKNTE